jgi:hypothetical protein
MWQKPTGAELGDAYEMQIAGDNDCHGIRSPAAEFDCVWRRRKHDDGAASAT